MEWNKVLIDNLSILAVIIIVTIVVNKLATKGINKIVLDNEVQYRLRKVIGAFSYLLVAIATIIIFGKNISGIGVALGVAGAGVAFALQEVIASFAGWIALSLGGFYKPGDRIQLGGIAGDVIDIGVLRTTIMETGGWVKGDLYNGRIVRVANSFVFKEPVYNYSGEFPYLWDEIIIPIRQTSDHRLARTIIENACHTTVSELSDNAKTNWKKLKSNYRLEDANLDPIVSLIVTDNWLEYTARYVVDYKFRRKTKDELFEHILDEIAKTNGKVQLASTTIEITNFNQNPDTINP